ncbi:MAG: SIR2 family NAD-dependent protein deacylase, partial [Chitinophagaceae bacterium]
KPKLVILTGAGISADSGLKTFRDGGGLWEGYDVMEVASPEGWTRNPALVLDFYNSRRREILLAKPNLAHLGLVQLEKKYEVTIITQNIDDLHERAGSSRVIHLHGEIFKMRSELSSPRLYPITGDIQLGERAEDGGQLRPHIVWFGEEVPLIQLAKQEISLADYFVLIGTSLNVYPASGLMDDLPTGVPKYIIDKKIPKIQLFSGLHLIEKSAILGITDLLHQLL